MTLLDTYNGFMAALAAGQLDSLPAFVDPGEYTETCVRLTGWTQGLDVALANRPSVRTSLQSQREADAGPTDAESRIEGEG
jgi:hypothetical protein